MTATPLWLLLAAASSSGSAPEAAAPPVQAELPFDGDEVVVPMDTSRKHTDVEVFLGDRGPFRFQLDTYAGAPVCIDDDLAAELGLEVVGTGRNSDGVTTRTVEYVGIDELRFGAATFRDLRALVDDYDHVPTSKGGSLQGLLGFPLFRDLLLTVDYPRERIVLGRGELDAGPGVTSFEFFGNVPDVQVRIGDHERTFGLDTGAEIGLRLLDSDLEDLVIHGEARVIGRARTVYNAYTIRGAYVDEPIAFGGLEFDAVFASFSEGTSATKRLIGYSLLRGCTLTFDQRNRRLRLEREPLPAAVALTEAQRARWEGSYGDGRQRIVVQAVDGELAVQFPTGPRLAAVAVAADELAFPRCATRLSLRVEAGVEGLLVVDPPDLRTAWFAPAASAASSTAGPGGE